MHPIIPYFEPLKIHLGPLTLHGFGILVAIAFLVGSQVAENRAERVGVDPDFIRRLIGWLVVGTLVGGHLGYAIFYDTERVYLSEPIRLLYVWEGLSSYGGFFTCILLIIWFFRKEKQPFYPFGDSLAYGFSAGYIFGRLGCFAAHDHPGPESDFWLAVPGMCPGGDPTQACHDMGLYEAMFVFCIYMFFRFMDRKPRFPGFYIAWLGMLYGIVRFNMERFRVHESHDPLYGGLTPAQYGSIIVFLAGLTLFFKQWKKPPFVPPASDADGEGTAAEA